uniref:Uncharacterized protein n=1 Tax=Rhizophora mucronata TaxID=61149 RepID=A0A2P2PC19_RHIMU
MAKTMRQNIGKLTEHSTAKEVYIFQ